MQYIAFTWPIDADGAEVEEQIADRMGENFDGPITHIHTEPPVEEGEHGVWLYSCDESVFNVETHPNYDAEMLHEHFYFKPEYVNGPLLFI